MESIPYQKRLRLSEVNKLLQFKKQLHAGLIADFRLIHDILDKIEWFRQYQFMERQTLVERASIRMYEPNEIIFSQGDPSPDLFLIIYGSVKSTV